MKTTKTANESIWVSFASEATKLHQIVMNINQI